MSASADDNPGNIPLPDPTVLTTKQLLREIEGVKDLLQGQLDDRGTLSDQKILALARLMDEKFVGVGTRFDLGEASRIELSGQGQIALAAALATSEKALDKAQADTEKRIEQLNGTIDAAFVGMTVRIDDLKDRLSRAESGRTGQRDAYAGLYLAAGLVVAVVSIAVSVIVNK